MPDQLVSVVVPAYNSERTIGETLHSVRSQTHQNLEIIVVDDGSTDATAAIVRIHKASDDRIRLIEQNNAGVAAARNAGAEQARGEFLAPIDADDLWDPRKIAKQLEAFARSPPTVGVVYTWFALLDEESRIIHTKHRPDYAGHVLPNLAEFNFVGNGSSPLIRLDAFRQTAGYDPTLKARGGQGCEDWKLYCELAERVEYAFVGEHLTGYRTSPDNMSANVVEMLRSRDFATADLMVTHPELRSRFRLGRNRLSRFMLHRAIRRRSVREIFALMVLIGTFDPRFLFATLANLPSEVLDQLKSETVMPETKNRYFLRRAISNRRRSMPADLALEGSGRKPQA